MVQGTYTVAVFEMPYYYNILTVYAACSMYRCISINLNVVDKLIYFSNSTQIVQLRVLNKLNAHRLKQFKSLVLLIVMVLAHI